MTLFCLKRNSERIEDILRAVKPVVLPQCNVIHEMIQIYICGKPLLRTEKTEYDDDPFSTARLVKEVLDEFKIKYRGFSPYFGYWFPNSQGRKYKIVGSGRCRLTSNEFIISREHDEDYPYGLDREHFETVSFVQGHTGRMAPHEPFLKYIPIKIVPYDKDLQNG